MTAVVEASQPRHVETVPRVSAPSSPESGSEGHADFIEFVRGKKYIPAVSHLQQASLELDGDRLRVLVQQQSFHADWLRGPEAQARLNELATEFFGRPVRIAVEETLKKNPLMKGSSCSVVMPSAARCITQWCNVWLKRFREKWLRSKRTYKQMEPIAVYPGATAATESGERFWNVCVRTAVRTGGR